MASKTPYKFNIIIFAIVFSISIFKICSFDIFWHLKCGEYIFTNLKIIDRNLFSFTFPNNDWKPTYWLFEVLVFLVHKAGGFSGLVFLRAFLNGIAYCALAGYASKKTSNILLLFFIFIAIIDLSFFRFMLRPHIFTFIGLSFLIVKLNQINDSKIHKKNAALILTIFLIWCNMHSGVIFGIIIFFVYLVSRIYSLLFSEGENNKREVIKLSILFVASFLITFLNPTGFGLYAYVFDHMSIESVIPLEEFKMLTFESHLKPIIMILMISVLPMMLLISEKKIKIMNIGYFVLALTLLRKGIRFIPDSSLILFPNLLDSLKIKKYFKGIKLNKRLTSIILISASLIYILHVHINSYKLPSSFFISGFGLNEEMFPVKASLKINSSKINIFNSFSTGGYLIWKYNGKLKVFQDGRIHAYPFEFFQKIDEAKIDMKKWEALLEYYKITNLLLNLSETSKQQIDYLLEKGWELLYSDENFMFFARKE